MAEREVVADAPGRVNLIGEHTDYNDGFVLPTATPQRTRVTLTPRHDDRVRAETSAHVPEAHAEYRLGQETPGLGWLDYVQGITRLIAETGHQVHGFDLRVDSEVPVGSGLSSSAALGVSLLRALRTAFDLDLDDLALARLVQRGENEFVGAHVGIMDPIAATFADTSAALFLDTRSLRFERVALPPNADLVVIHSGVRHALAGGEYNQRRADCEQACRLLGVAALRDLTLADLPRLDALPQRIRRRARHVITEDDRVLRFVEALARDDLHTLGALLLASHASLRDDYEVSVPAVDRLVELAEADADVYGARITGGGFGGAVVMLARQGTGGDVGRRLLGPYAEQTGETPQLLVPAA